MYKISVSAILNAKIIPITKDGERLTCYETLANFRWEMGSGMCLLRKNY